MIAAPPTEKEAFHDRQAILVCDEDIEALVDEEIATAQDLIKVRA